MIQAVIFDFDGLIIDSEPLQSKAFEMLLTKYGKVPVLNNRGLVHEPGVGEPINNTKIIQHYEIKEKLDIFMEKRRKIYLELLKAQMKPITGFLPLIKKLKRKNIKMAIATSSPKNQINLVLSNLEIKNYFQVVVSANDVKRLKPHPDLYLKTLKKLSEKPTECIALEDSESGVVSAKTAGLYVIAIPSQYTKHQNFSQADMILENLSEFHTLLKIL